MRGGKSPATDFKRAPAITTAVGDMVDQNVIFHLQRIFPEQFQGRTAYDPCVKTSDTSKYHECCSGLSNHLVSHGRPVQKTRFIIEKRIEIRHAATDKRPGLPPVGHGKRIRA